MSRAVPAWWPPKVGSTLRHDTHHSAGAGRIKRVEALLHVLAVFVDKDGAKRIVTAEWFPAKRQWSYAVEAASAAVSGRIWPDGTKRPATP